MRRSTSSLTNERITSRACADDDALRGRGRLLLDAYARSTGFLGSPAVL